MGSSISQSVSSRRKISLTGFLNNLDSFNARTVDGMYLFFSIEFIVCLETPIIFANCSCVRLSSALSIFNLLYTSKSFESFKE